jgi:hypothetical protein
VGSFLGRGGVRVELDETLRYGKLRIKVNNFMGFGWGLLEMEF